MEVSETDIKRVLEILKEEKRKQTEVSEEEPKPGAWDRLDGFLSGIQESKAFDFFVNITIAFACGMFSFFIPQWFLLTFPKVPATLAETLMVLGITATKFFIARLIVDLSLFFSENVFWNFLKRNGDNSFDFQENLKSLTAWQQNLISIIKYLGYLLLFALLMLT